MNMEPEDLGYGQLEEKKIETLAGYGLADREIARVLGVSEPELKANHATAIESGRIKANARVAESLYRKATGEGREAVTAAIFWLKTRARWKETSVHELAGSGEPITFKTIYETKPGEA